MRFGEIQNKIRSKMKSYMVWLKRILVKMMSEFEQFKPWEGENKSHMELPVNIIISLPVTLE